MASANPTHIPSYCKSISHINVFSKSTLIRTYITLLSLPITTVYEMMGFTEVELVFTKLLNVSKVGACTCEIAASQLSVCISK